MRRNLIKERKDLRKLKVPYPMIEFYFGMTFNYPICCVTQFVLDNCFLGRFSRIKHKNRGYSENDWWPKIREFKYIPCSFHLWLFLKDKRNLKCEKKQAA